MEQNGERIEHIRRRVSERFPMYSEDPGFEAWLLQKTGDDPERLDRMLELLHSYGYITGEGTLANDYIEMPEPEEVIADVRQRLERIDPATLRLLEVASIEGDHFSREIVQGLVEEGERARGVEMPMQRALDAGVIAPDHHPAKVAALAHRYRFVPLQLRNAIYEQIPRDERARLHLRLVELLGEQLAGVDDPAEQDVLHALINEHNDLASRPERYAST